MKPSIYIAGRYSRKSELRLVALFLRAQGFAVTSRWLEENHAPNVTMAEMTQEELKDIARIDLEDIVSADVMLFYCEPQDKQPPRGGRHVEFGMAHALGKTIVTVGDPENVFHYLPGVFAQPDLWRAVEFLTKRYGGNNGASNG